MSDYFFQIVLLLAGAVIGVVAQILPKEQLKIIARALAALLIAVSLVWAGYEWGSTRPKTIPPTCPSSTVIVEESLVDVPANKYWYDTGIKAQRGDCLEFSATGTWWSGISQTGPDGDGGIPPFGWFRPACGQCPVPDGNLGELVGKVDDGVPFRIGSSAILQIDRNGNIILAMNETTGPCDGKRKGSCYDDNEGALKVKVTVRRIE